MKIKIEKPEYVYAGFGPCGCLVTLISDIPSEKKFVSKMVAEVIARGDTIKRISHTESVELLNTVGIGCSCDGDI